MRRPLSGVRYMKRVRFALRIWGRRGKGCSVAVGVRKPSRVDLLGG